MLQFVPSWMSKRKALFLVPVPYILCIYTLRSMTETSKSENNSIILLLGDSTMARAATALSQKILLCTIIQKQSRCNLAEYFGMEYRNMTTEIPYGIGPTLYGKRNRGCQDCSSCTSRAWSCAGDMELHYIGIEFAKDIIYPTERFATTQESVVLGYLPQIVSRVKMCIFNTGLHDLALLSPSLKFKSQMIESARLYKDNLTFYTELLLQHFDLKNLYWLSTTPVIENLIPNKYRKITNNKNIKHFNKIAKNIMIQRNIRIFDTFFLAQEEKYALLNIDGIHWGTEKEMFYMTLSNIFLCLFNEALTISGETPYLGEPSLCNTFPSDWAASPPPSS